jgi:hypothetical protein
VSARRRYGPGSHPETNNENPLKRTTQLGGPASHFGMVELVEKFTKSTFILHRHLFDTPENAVLTSGRSLVWLAVVCVK